jgi:hypothetical protein
MARRRRLPAARALDQRCLDPAVEMATSVSTRTKAPFRTSALTTTVRIPVLFMDRSGFDMGSGGFGLCRA